MRMYYNVPVAWLDSFKDDHVIVRSRNFSELVESLSKASSDNLLYLQLLSLDQDLDTLSVLKKPLRLDLVLGDASEFPLLYRFAAGGRLHDIRVTVPVAPGCTKAVRLAVSLGFPVKLRVSRLDEALVDELIDILRYYLHHNTVAQPIEFFHSLLAAFYLKDPKTIWEIQEEHPALSRYVTDAGEIVLSDRLTIPETASEASRFIDGHQFGSAPEQGECSLCQYFGNCCGYFKIPDKDFSCKGVRKLFQMIEDAAAELLHSLSEIPEEEGTQNP